MWLIYRSSYYDLWLASVKTKTNRFLYSFLALHSNINEHTNHVKQKLLCAYLGSFRDDISRELNTATVESKNQIFLPVKENASKCKVKYPSLRMSFMKKSQDKECITFSNGLNQWTILTIAAICKWGGSKHCHWYIER